jgi:hypothetical protein
VINGFLGNFSQTVLCNRRLEKHDTIPAHSLMIHRS